MNGALYIAALVEKVPDVNVKKTLLSLEQMLRFYGFSRHWGWSLTKCNTNYGNEVCASKVS
jgi:hypothetical protein